MNESHHCGCLADHNMQGMTAKVKPESASTLQLQIRGVQRGTAQPQRTSGPCAMHLRMYLRARAKRILHAAPTSDKERTEQWPRPTESGRSEGRRMLEGLQLAGNAPGGQLSGTLTPRCIGQGRRAHAESLQHAREIRRQSRCAIPYTVGRPFQTYTTHTHWLRRSKLHTGAYPTWCSHRPARLGFDRLGAQRQSDQTNGAHHLITLPPRDRQRRVRRWHIFQYSVCVDVPAATSVRETSSWTT